MARIIHLQVSIFLYFALCAGAPVPIAKPGFWSSITSSFGSGGGSTSSGSSSSFGASSKSSGSPPSYHADVSPPSYNAATGRSGSSSGGSSSGSSGKGSSRPSSSSSSGIGYKASTGQYYDYNDYNHYSPEPENNWEMTNSDSGCKSQKCRRTVGIVLGSIFGSILLLFLTCIICQTIKKRKQRGMDSTTGLRAITGLFTRKKSNATEAAQRSATTNAAAQGGDPDALPEAPEPERGEKVDVLTNNGDLERGEKDLGTGEGVTEPLPTYLREKS